MMMIFVFVGQIQGVYSDVTAETMYDVIHDPQYRKTWDTQILEGYDICRVNANSDIGYYASKKQLKVYFQY